MIKSFKSEDTEKIFPGHFSRKLPQEIQQVGARKLEQLHAAHHAEYPTRATWQST